MPGQPADRAEPRTPDVLVLPAFGADDFELDDPSVSDELARWLDAYDFDGTLDVQGANAPVQYTADGVAVTPTGMGKAAAASTVSSLCASPALDLSETTVVTVGIAGGPPRQPVGSVVVADTVVDWDLKHRFDPDTGEPPIEPLSYRPHDYVWKLGAGLVSTAVDAIDAPALATDEAITDRRRNLDFDELRPIVSRGVTITGDEFWHGSDLAEEAEWLCQQYGLDGYDRTEMEDAATATALARHDLLDRYVSVRAIANYDRPVDGRADGVDDTRLELGLENAFRAGRQVVERFGPSTGDI